MDTRLKLVLFLFLLVFPAVLSAVTAKLAFTRAETVEFCSSCHTMDPWVADVTGDASDSLAHDHFARRWIQHDQCYTCHSNYGFLGPLKAKIGGVKHVIAFYTGFEGKIHLYEDFPNANCLQCHQNAKGFREESAHDPIDDLIAGKDRCVECHDQLHNVEQEETAAAEPASAHSEKAEAEDAAAPAGGEGKPAAGEAKPATAGEAAPSGKDDKE